MTPPHGTRASVWPTRDLRGRWDSGAHSSAIRYTERLGAAGIEALVGSRGDAYDNALAESVIRLFKTEVILSIMTDRGAAWTMWNTRRWNGSRGSTRAG